MITTRWYRAFSMSNSSSPIPVPIAVMSAWISAFWRALSSRAFSTFRILPRMGRIAWIDRSRACLAEPPAESPSTTNSSHIEGSVLWQSASLPGSVVSSSPLRRVRSRAARAASRAFAACDDFRKMRFASPGCSSRNVVRRSLTVVSTSERIDALPSFVLVWPSNCGSRSFTDTMPTSPSRTSSPRRLSSFSLSSPFSRA